MSIDEIKRAAAGTTDSELESAVQLEDWPYAEQIIRSNRQDDNPAASFDQWGGGDPIQ